MHTTDSEPFTLLATPVMETVSCSNPEKHAVILYAFFYGNVNHR